MATTLHSREPPNLVPRFGEPLTHVNRLSRHKSNFQRTFITLKQRLKQRKNRAKTLLKARYIIKAFSLYK